MSPLISVPSRPAAQLLPLVVVCGPMAGEFCRALLPRGPRGSLAVLSTATTDPLTNMPVSLSERITQIVSAGSAEGIVIQCEPETDPAALIIGLSEDESAGRLSSDVQLTAAVVAVSAETLTETLTHQQARKESWSASAIAEQIEFASLVVLDPGTAGADVVTLAKAIVAALNPHAPIISPGHDSIPAKLFDAALPFVFDAGLTESHWRALMDEDASLGVGSGIEAVAYRARRPFHPQRFWDFLKKDLGGVIRAKGFFWLATQMDIVTGLNVAGAEKQAAPVGQWWAAIVDGPSPGSECPESIRREWMEPFGDRRQSLAFIGINLDRTGLRTALDACLLTDDEMAGGKDSWLAWSDPFPKWSQPAQQHEHEHGCSHHDCCGHHE